MVPLITSIPPRMSRQDASGQAIGEEYQMTCIDSWRRCGFEVFSVNARSELDRMPRRPGVTYWPIERDAQEVAGRPLVWIQDLLAASREIAQGPFALTNADIMLRKSSGVLDTVSRLEPGHALIAKRVDVEDASGSGGRPYRHGYDLFGLHRDDLHGWADSGLIFGCPWWDYMIPYVLLTKDVELHSPSGQPAAHLVHSDRWPGSQWFDFGASFLHFVRGTIDQSDPKRHARYLQIVRETTHGKRSLPRRLIERPAKAERKTVKRLARAMVWVVDMASGLDRSFRLYDESGKLAQIQA